MLFSFLILADLNVPKKKDQKIERLDREKYHK